MEINTQAGSVIGAVIQPCRTRCEVWTRVMGYHRPVSHFNIGKKSEHYSRKHFQECLTANASFIAEYTPEMTVAVAVC